MSSLCRFGKSVMDTILYWVNGDDVYISDEWKCYNEIERIFRGDGWIDGGEADDLRSQIEKLERELIEAEGRAR